MIRRAAACLPFLVACEGPRAPVGTASPVLELERALVGNVVSIRLVVVEAALRDGSTLSCARLSSGEVRLDNPGVTVVAYKVAELAENGAELPDLPAGVPLVFEADGFDLPGGLGTLRATGCADGVLVPASGSVDVTIRLAAIE